MASYAHDWFEDGGSSDKAGDYVQRELEEPVRKLVDDKLNDPFIATKKGERERPRSCRRVWQIF